MKNRVLVFIGIMVLFICACRDRNIQVDPALEQNYNIVNQSSYPIVTWVGVLEDSIVIPSQSDFNIYSFTSIGKVSPFGQCEVWELDSLAFWVQGLDSLIITIDPFEETNWLYTILEENTLGGGSISCTLNINDEDIE